MRYNPILSRGGKIYTVSTQAQALDVFPLKLHFSMTRTPVTNTKSSWYWHPLFLDPSQLPISKCLDNTLSYIGHSHSGLLIVLCTLLMLLSKTDSSIQSDLPTHVSINVLPEPCLNSQSMPSSPVLKPTLPKPTAPAGFPVLLSLDWLISPLTKPWF
jgi:hypothetical protein